MMGALNNLFRHPAVIAVLSFSLGTGATLWLNQQSRERAALSEAVTLAEQGVADTARVRLAARRLAGEITAGDGRGNLLERASASELALVAQRIAVEAGLAPRGYRLARYVGADPAAPGTARILEDTLWALVREMETCARGMVDMLRFGLGDKAPAVHRSLNCLPGSQRLPATADPIAFGALAVRARQCETTVLSMLVPAIERRDSGRDVYDAALAGCGLAHVNGQLRFTPIPEGAL